MSEINKLKDIVTFIKSPKLYILTGIIILVLLIAIMLLNKKEGKWLRKISIPTIIVSLMLITSKFIMPNIITKLISKKLDKTFVKIVEQFIKSLFNNLFMYGLILFIVSLILLIIYILHNKKVKAKEN